MGDHDLRGGLQKPFGLLCRERAHGEPRRRRLRRSDAVSLLWRGSEGRRCVGRYPRGGLLELPSAVHTCLVGGILLRTRKNTKTLLSVWSETDKQTGDTHQ